MYKIYDPDAKEWYDIERFSFMKRFKSKWEQIHNNTNVFQYKISNLKDKILNEKYFLQLNPDRSSKRRTPEQIDSIFQPFNPSKFNFTKVSSDEIMFDIEEVDKDCRHTVLVNISPISQYHSLLCPFREQCLPQIVTKESLNLAINIMVLAKDRDLRIGFNSLCALASVNHLHYHLCIVEPDLPVENLKCDHLKGTLYCLDKTYPAPGFCFEISQSTQVSKDIFKLLEYLLNKSIAHNVLITRGRSLTGASRESIRVIIFPRKSSSGAKQFDAFNVAVFELSGWLGVSNEEIFTNISQDEIDREITKWKLDNFEDICEEVKLLY